MVPFAATGAWGRGRWGLEGGMETCSLGDVSEQTTGVELSGVLDTQGLVAIGLKIAPGALKFTVCLLPNWPTMLATLSAFSCKPSIPIR